jgi:hypothetical protein
MRLSGVPGLGAGTGIALLDTVGDVSSSGVLGAGIVVSDGAGSVTAQTIPISSEVVYYVEISAGAITACQAINCWLEPSSTTTATSAHHVEFPPGFTPVHGIVSVNVISNTVIAGTIGVDQTQSGSNIGSGVVLTSSTPTGIISSSFSVTASSTDTFGLAIAASGIAATSGPLVLAIRYSLSEF